jgi:hypothetical protein
MRWLSVEEVAESLDWDARALGRLMRATRGSVLPGAFQDDDGAWSVPESALRRITGAGLFLFSIPTLAGLLDCSEDHLRELVRTGKLNAVKIPDVGQRVPWAEYQRLTGRRRA